MRRYAAVFIAGSAFIFAACAQEHIYAKVCADTEVKPVVRVVDDKCDQQSTNDRYRWRYYQPEVWIDPVGKPLPDKKYSYGEPNDAETVVRIPEKDGGTGYSVH